MRKKLREAAGVTMVEMLAAVAILMLLGMMLNTGLQMALNSYRNIIAKSEVELLLSTAMDALADDLRFARNVEQPTVYSTDDVPFTYTSDSFAGTIHLERRIDEDNEGQIMAHVVGSTGLRFLSTGVYGAKGADGKRAYQVTEMKITPKINAVTKEVTFTIELKVQATADPTINASGTMTVRCLNPYTPSAGAGGG